MTVAPDPIAAFGASAARAGLFLDFDGVLADIAPEPDQARIRPGVAQLLVALGERLGRVAVISGRPVSYVDDMVPTEVDIVGLYGLEWRLQGVHHTLPVAEEWRTVVSELVADAAARFGASAVEPKGLSLTVHYRNEPARSGAMRGWVEERAAATGLEPRPAKHSFELHPPIDRNKGTALVELAAELDPVAYLGDDVGDLPAFDGLDELASRGAATVRVAVDSSELPDALRDRADLVVDGPAGAQALLERLLTVVSPPN